MKPGFFQGMAAGAAIAVLAGCAEFTAVSCGLENFDKILAADAPVKTALCRSWANAVSKNPGLQTYCNHLPTSVAEAIIDTWPRVFWAMAWQVSS